MSNYVQDDEVLYRCVYYDLRAYKLTPSGDLKVTSDAFLDRNKQPSVDRARLCHSDPHYTQGKDKRNGVVYLIAREIRAIDDLIRHGSSPETYTIDVAPVPLHDNPAHAEIRTSPQIASQNVFRRLRRSLAILANNHGWLVRPGGFRNAD
jgi:hypothetical protein